MFAVIRSGGKQYKVTKGDVLKLEKLEQPQGSIILFDEVLMVVGDDGKVTTGTPLVSDIKVSAEIIKQEKDKKVLVFKKKRRHNYRRLKGHRQQVTWVKVQDIGTGLKEKKAAPQKEVAKEAPAEEKKAAPAKKAESKKPAEKKAEAPKKAAEKAPTKKSEAKKETKAKPAAKKSAAKKPAAKKPAAKKTTKK